MWDAIRKFFRDSETLALARFQMVIGTIAGIVTYVEPSLLAPILPAEWLPWFLAANGIATEYLRRRRAEDM